MLKLPIRNTKGEEMRHTIPVLVLRIFLWFIFYYIFYILKFIRNFIRNQHMVEICSDSLHNEDYFLVFNSDLLILPFRDKLLVLGLFGDFGGLGQWGLVPGWHAHSTYSSFCYLLLFALWCQWCDIVALYEAESSPRVPTVTKRGVFSV